VANAAEIRVRVASLPGVQVYAAEDVGSGVVLVSWVGGRDWADDVARAAVDASGRAAEVIAGYDSEAVARADWPAQRHDLAARGNKPAAPGLTPS